MKTKSKIVLLLISAVILSLLLWVGLKLSQQDDAAIHIAFVGPMSGDSAVVGQSMTQAIQLYFDSVNQQGGINHQKIVLDIFDDRNDPNTALKVAQDIVEQNRAVAVIGHHDSACSIKAGTVYKKTGILAITPTATHIDVAQDNRWYFRTVFNDNLQARFLAYYAKLMLNQNTVSIISTDEPYGSSLASLFETASKNLIDIKYKWLLSDSNNLEPQIAQIVSDLQTKPDAGLIFLATQVPEGIKLVKLIKEAGIKNPLMAPDSYASHKFSQGFLNYPKEKRTPGYYTNGLYVSTPFLFDTANRLAYSFNTRYQKQYHEKLPWPALYAVDAAMVLIEAIKQAKIRWQPESLGADRTRIRDRVYNNFNTPKNAVTGNTGLIYFDENGEALKSVSMGVYKNNRLISAFKQLQMIPSSPERIEQLAPQEERIFFIDDQYMYKTDIVYTGIQLNSISNFNPKTLTYSLDFYLWFRFQGTIRPEQIHFINAVEPIQLGTPILEKNLGQETYRLYKATGNFKKNLYSSEPEISLTQHVLGVTFRHRDLDRNHLIYVNDVLGMELTTSLDKIDEIQGNSALEDWKIKEINFFQGIRNKKILGDPEYLVPENTIEYSTFNADLLISSQAYAYHALIPSQFVLGLLVFSGVMTLLLILVSYKDKKVKRLKSLWIFQVIFLFLLLITTEIFVIAWIIEKNSLLIPIESILTAFKMLWWIISAILLNIAVKRFLWLPLEEKTERAIPNLVRFVTASLIYILALFGIMAFVLARPLTSLLATSGVVTIIIGLAVQMNLSNIFSGIALNIDRSIRIGDWVKIGAFDDSKVVNMNWRVTQIETRLGYIVSIPNSTVATSDIHNFSYPDEQYWLRCRVPIDPKYDPRKIEEILLNAVLSVEQGVVKDFKPFIWLENLQIEDVSNMVAIYVVFFKTENYQNKFRVLKQVWKNIWIHLNEAGIIPTMAQADESGKKEPVALTTSELKRVLNPNQLQNMVFSDRGK